MNRMEKENELRLKQKANFYYSEKLICHVIKEPKGFVNGWFRSDLIDNIYYNFEDQRWPGEEVKLFLCDIFDINDYQVKE
jgi:hypothetical protein